MIEDAHAPSKTFFIFNFLGGIFFASPDRAHREQPIGGQKQFVRARVRSAWRVGVKKGFESANFRMPASIADDPKATKKADRGLPFLIGRSWFAWGYATRGWRQKKPPPRRLFKPALG